MNYVNPVTGGHVMQTIGASMQLLRPGEKTKSHRHTGSFIYQVTELVLKAVLLPTCSVPPLTMVLPV